METKEMERWNRKRKWKRKRKLELEMVVQSVIVRRTMLLSESKLPRVHTVATSLDNTVVLRLHVQQLQAVYASLTDDAELEMGVAFS